MQIFCLLLGITYFLSPGQGQEVEKYNFTVHKRFARSVINMDELLHLEEDLAVNLEQYVKALSQKANTIKIGIEEMTIRHEHWMELGLKQDWDPVNSYSLIRHMQADWMMWQLYMKKIVGQEKLDYLNSKMSVMPQDWDFKDAAEGIRRVQGVYEMSASDIAQGLLDGVQYDASLTARDCLEMAHHLMNSLRWKRAREWLTAGIEALEGPNYQPELQQLTGPNEVELYRILGQLLVKLNDSDAALIAYRNALNEYPNNAELFQEYRLAETHFLTRPGNDSEPEDNYDKYALPSCCSGRCELPKELRLYCLYNTTASPFLRLAPIKTEILSLDPYIVLFHDVVSRKDMHRIREGSKPHLVPSSTYVPKTNTYHILNFRTSQSVWLPWDWDNATVRITNMLEDATALNLNSSEMFQVMNYGVGGLFEIHTDTLLSDKERFNGTEDRIATALIYLSEVQQGGATVFPQLNLTVFPEPGSVLFWYLLDTRGNEDIRTEHAGCPVIVGSKWVMSKWISNLGQEFRKPCYDFATS